MPYEEPRNGGYGSMSPKIERETKGVRSEWESVAHAPSDTSRFGSSDIPRPERVTNGKAPVQDDVDEGEPEGGKQ